MIIKKKNNKTMGLLNCKCESEEDKTVLVEALGKNKLETSAPVPLNKPRFCDMIPALREELAISGKAI